MTITIPHVVEGEPLRISASTFVEWKKCPDNANARLQGHYPPDTKASFAGSLAHRVFSRHLKEGPIEKETFAKACFEEIGQSNLNYKMGDLGFKSTASLMPMIEEVSALYERFTRMSAEGFEDAEVLMTFEAADGLDLVGKVDAVYREDLGGHRLVDWKTGELLDVEDQLGFYALLWTLEHGKLPVLVEAMSVRTGESHRSRPTAEGVQGVAKEVATMANQLRRAWSDGTGVERRPGPWCRFCPILDDCPDGQAVEELLD